MDLHEIPAVDYSEYEEHHEVTMEEDKDDSDLPLLRSLFAQSRVPPSATYTNSVLSTMATSTTLSAAAAASSDSSSIVAALQQVRMYVPCTGMIYMWVMIVWGSGL